MISAIRILPMTFISLAIFIGVQPIADPSVAAQSVSKGVLIYQLQTGASGSASQEYISIYNNSDAAIDVTNWCVVYASSSDGTQTQLGCLKPSSAAIKLYLPAQTPVTLASTEMVQANPNFIPDIVFTAGIASTSGHIKLLNLEKQTVDVLGWGSAVHPENISATPSATGKILQRQNVDEVLQDTNDNSKDFYHTELAIMPSGNIYEETVLLPAIATPILNELFPDAIGADAGKEFIELYNPTDETINLNQFSLALGPSFSKKYPLPNSVIEPHAYISFTDTESGVTLPNTNATLRLFGPNEILADEVSYDNIEEGASYAYANGGWQQTFVPTPGAENNIVLTEPCPERQTRNIESGQCKSIGLASSVLECKVGQVRNPDTDRCKNNPLVSTLARACKVGQEKNPSTNRCRNIAAAVVAKPCPAGQERNTGTGRCKKITALASAGTNSVKDAPSPLVANNAKWWIVGAAAIGTIVYAIYEWRQEVLNFAISLKNKLLPS